jgi:hypothetical protein
MIKGQTYLYSISGPFDKCVENCHVIFHNYNYFLLKVYPYRLKKLGQILFKYSESKYGMWIILEGDKMRRIQIVQI